MQTVAFAASLATLCIPVVGVIGVRTCRQMASLDAVPPWLARAKVTDYQPGRNGPVIRKLDGDPMKPQSAAAPENDAVTVAQAALPQKAA